MRPQSACRRLGAVLANLVWIVFATPIAFAATAGADPVNVPDRVHALRLQADELAARQEYGAATPLLEELIRLDQARPFAPQRSLGRDLISVASTLLPGEQYASLEYVFKRGIQVLQASPDVRPGDVVVALHNLSALYNRTGDAAARDRIMSAIVNMAEDLQQPVDSDTVEIFLELALLYKNAGQNRPVAILFRRLDGFMLDRYRDDPRMLAEWLATYGHSLLADRQFDAALATFGKALALRESVSGQPSKEVANAISDLAGAHFKAGALAVASGEYWRAIVARRSSPAVSN